MTFTVFALPRLLELQCSLKSFLRLRTWILM